MPLDEVRRHRMPWCSNEVRAAAPSSSGMECRGAATKSALLLRAAAAWNAVVQQRSPRCCSEQQRHRVPWCSNEVRCSGIECRRAATKSALQSSSGMECRCTKSDSLEWRCTKPHGNLSAVVRQSGPGSCRTRLRVSGSRWNHEPTELRSPTAAKLPWYEVPQHRMPWHDGRRPKMPLLRYNKPLSRSSAALKRHPRDCGTYIGMECRRTS
jgi:hypothetical protein